MDLTTEGGEKRTPIFHEGPGNAGEDEKGRDGVGDGGAKELPAVRGRAFGNRVSDLGNDHGQKHASDVFDGKIPKGPIFHRGSEIIHRGLGDGAEKIKNDSDDELQIENAAEDETAFAVLIAPSRTKGDSAPCAEKSPEGSENHHPAEEAMDIFENQVGRHCWQSIRRIVEGQSNPDFGGAGVGNQDR